VRLFFFHLRDHVRSDSYLYPTDPQSDLSIVAMAEAVIELPPWKVQLLADMVSELPWRRALILHLNFTVPCLL
jgi:hypothetical protein